MRCALSKILPLMGALLGGIGGVHASQTAPQPEMLDRIVARVENDIILLSEMQELAAYQQLLEGRAEPQDKLLRRLIEQWVVRSEAQSAQFPSPEAREVDAEMDQIRSRFATPQAYNERLAAVGLSPQVLRRLVEQQFYLARFLDYKFRPAVQVEDEAITKYYQDELVPALQARGQTAPPLDDVREQIRDLLTERGINERADSWFEETESRLQIEILPPPARKESP
jgi:hypothetical protein